MNGVISRRLFVRKWFFSGLLLVGVVALAGGCASKEKKSPAEKEDAADQIKGTPSGSKANNTGDPCTDYSGVSEADLKIRAAMAYVPLSTVEGKQCDNCNLYLPGTGCGSCQLFKGPVTANGNCTYWVPQV